MFKSKHTFLPGLWKMFIWLLWGDFVLVLMEQVMPSLFPLLLRNYGASNRTIGLIMGTLPTFIGLFLIPYVSYKSDRSRSPLGRRRPFLLMSAPLIVISMILFPFAPEITKFLLQLLWMQRIFALIPALPVICVAAWLFLLYGVFNAICASAYNWLVVDMVPRDYMGRYMSLSRIFSLIGMFIFNFFLMGLAETHLKEIFVGAALVYGIGFGLVSWKVHEPHRPALPADELSVNEPRGYRRWGNGIGNFFKICFTTPFYLLIYLAFLLYAWSALAGNLFAVLFMNETLKMDYSTIGTMRAWVTVAVIPVSYFFGKFIDRWKPQNVVIPAVLLYAAGNLACFFFIRGTVSFLIWTFITNISAFFWGVAYTTYLATTLPKASYAQLSTAMGLVTGLLGAAIMSPVCGAFFDLLKNNYRYIYVWQTVFLLLCAVVFWKLRKMWLAYGGPDNYRPPFPISAESASAELNTNTQVHPAIWG
ncbi:MAG: MFS transporter [Sedimentisphaerales bacterium]